MMMIMIMIMMILGDDDDLRDDGLDEITKEYSANNSIPCVT